MVVAQGLLGVPIAPNISMTCVRLPFGHNGQVLNASPISILPAYCSNKKARRVDGTVRKRITSKSTAVMTHSIDVVGRMGVFASGWEAKCQRIERRGRR